MLYTKIFENYEEFKQLFGLYQAGTKEDGTPKMVRNNKIYLQSMKHAWRNGKRELFEKTFIDISNTGISDYWHPLVGYSNIIEFIPIPKGYKMDEYNGLCEDGDSKSVRYINEDGKIFKMKVGKFTRKALIDYGVNEIVGETGVNYICEIVTQKWESYSSSIIPKYKLKVDKDFEFIYNSYNYFENDFGSCMTDQDQHDFYDRVDASAASIINSDGKIMARCIIFESVKDRDGIVLRLAERQYSTKDLYKQILIDKLLSEKRIDGYKRIGSGCGDADAFVRVDGETSVRFSIKCSIDYDDKISYQDSFKWLDMDGGVAYNWSAYHTHNLDTTDEYLEGRNYDDYAEENTNEDVYPYECWCCGSYDTRYTTEATRDNQLYYSESTGDYYDVAYYSEIMEDYLPKDRWCEMEEEWKESNWEWDEIYEEYVPCTMSVNIWEDDEYVTRYTSEDNSYDYHKVDGEYYDVINEETGLPLNVNEYENA